MLRILGPRANALALGKFVRTLSRYRELLLEMTYRDLIERNSASAVGALWVVFQPLLVMSIQTLVFAFVFKLRLNISDTGYSYVAYLLVGLAPWLSMQEAIGRAPFVLFENRNLVKQVVFPIEILPVKIVLASLVTLLVGLLVPLGIMLYTASAKPIWWMLLPFAVLVQVVMMVGLSYFLAALAIYLRDTKNLVQLFLMVGLFIHPILYTPGMLPRWVENAFELSPLSHVFWIYRDILVNGAITHPESWVVAPLIAVGILGLGYRFFSNLSHRFGDLL